MTWAQLGKLGGALPEVADDTCDRTPAHRLGGNGFVRRCEEGDVVEFATDDVDEQEALIETPPDLHVITDHDRAPAARARLPRLTVGEARRR